jgi:hypothetical protein
MRTTTVIQVLFLTASLAANATADILKLRNGQAVDGVFLGGSVRQIDFLTDEGEKQTFSLSEVTALAFSSKKTGRAPAGSPAATVRASAIIPAGTVLRVRTIDMIEADKSQAGAKFNGSLDDPVMVGGAVVIPRGADVVLQVTKVQQSGRMKGSDLVQLKINNILVRSTRYPVVTSVAEMKGGSEGKSTAKKAVGGAGLGAIIGGIAGGGKGAAIGALVGGAGGTALAATGEQHLKVPPESRLEFQLQADVTIK